MKAYINPENLVVTMGLFNRTKENPSKFYEEININALKITKLEGEIELLKQLMKNLRGLVNRRLKLDPEDQPEDINKRVLLPVGG